MRLLPICLLVAACGSQSPAPEKVAPPPETRPANQPLVAAPDAAPPPDDCANACTEIAVCWEEVNQGREYTQGGNCTSGCESATPEEQATFFACVARGRSACSEMIGCG